MFNLGHPFPTWGHGSLFFLSLSAGGPLLRRISWLIMLSVGFWIKVLCNMFETIDIPGCFSRQRSLEIKDAGGFSGVSSSVVKQNFLWRPSSQIQDGVAGRQLQHRIVVPWVPQNWRWLSQVCDICPWTVFPTAPFLWFLRIRTMHFARVRKSSAFFHNPSKFDERHHDIMSISVWKGGKFLEIWNSISRCWKQSPEALVISPHEPNTAPARLSRAGQKTSTETSGEYVLFASKE